MSTEGHAIEISKRWSFVWLFLSLLMFLVSGGKWVLPLAAWLAPLFMLRFIRLQSIWFGYFIASATLCIPAYFSLQDMIPLPFSTFIGTVVFGSFFGMFVYVLDKWLSPKIAGFISTLVFPCAFVAMEFLTSLSNPFGTWGLTAYTQIEYLSFLQLVSVTGIWGVAFLMAWAASVINWMWERSFVWREIRVGLLTYLALLVSVVLLGSARLTFFAPQGTTVRVAGVISPQFDRAWAIAEDAFLGKKKLAEVDWREFFAQAASVYGDLLERSRKAARAGAQIVLWSEAMGIVSKSDEEAWIERARLVAQQEKIYLGITLMPFIHTDPTRLPAQKMFENKLILLSPKGQILFTYHKTIPVPGAEEQMSVRGTGELPSVDTAYGRVGAAICFDADFPDLIRQAGKKGIDILLLPSADWRAIAPYHTQMASFRAIELGLSLVRIVRHGYSAAYDYQGRLLAGMDYFTTGNYTLYADVPRKGVNTLFTTLGNIFGWLSCVGLLIFLIFISVQKLRNRSRLNTL